MFWLSLYAFLITVVVINFSLSFLGGYARIIHRKTNPAHRCFWCRVGRMHLKQMGLPEDDDQ